MNAFKKLLGLLCIALAVSAEFALIKYTLDGTLIKDPLQQQIFAWTVIPVSLIVILGGLTLFGWYALRGEYDAEKM